MHWTRWLQLALLFYAVAVVCEIVLLFGELLEGHAELACTVEASELDWRPDISKCPDDVELWECIRHAMYREDI